MSKPSTRTQAIPVGAPVLYTAEEFALVVGVHADTVRKWIREGTVPVVRIGGTQRVHGSALEPLPATGAHAALVAEQAS